MRAYQFIVENDISSGSKVPLNISANEMTTLIKRDCSDFLKYVNGNTNLLLYRGFRNLNIPYFVGVPRNDRQPIDSGEKTQKFIDYILINAGFKATRTNSIFTTGDPDFASQYGVSYYVFPLNGFNYTYSNKIGDMYLHDLVGENGTNIITYIMNNLLAGNTKIKNKLKITYDKLHTLIPLLDNMEEYIDNNIDAFREYFKYDSFLYDAKYSFNYVMSLLRNILNYIRNYFVQGDNTNIKFDVGNFIRSLINARSYLLSLDMLFSKPSEHLKILDFKKILNFIDDELSSYNNLFHKDIPTTLSKEDCVKIAVNYLGFTNQDFRGALESGHEIYISGKYYAVKVGSGFEEQFPNLGIS